MTLPVAILAGGLATRLRPVTETIPKSMVDVAGQPFIERQLHYLRQQGIQRVVLCLGHLGAQVEAFVGDGHDFGLNVEYAWDGPTLLGTGGALRRALPKLGDAFFVFYGDSYLPVDFGAVETAFSAAGRPALMTVLHNDNRWDRSNVDFEAGLIIEYNKRVARPEMTYIDYGLSALRASILLPYAVDVTFDLGDVFHRLSLARQLAGFEVRERFYEIGSHQGLRDTIDHFSSQGNA
jgi:N-acetyl-alpha-D-muramate 1-phosphate uridylyltransferase